MFSKVGVFCIGNLKEKNAKKKKKRKSVKSFVKSDFLSSFQEDR